MMIDQLKQYLAPVPQPEKVNALREYLQWLILKILDARHYRKSMCFVGGTALRIVYQSNRFSEDLDFSLAEKADVDFDKMVETVMRDLEMYGFAASVTPKKGLSAVSSCFFRFSSLLFPLGLGSHADQKISIKLEIDKNPPQGAVVTEYFFNGPLLFSINHYDMPSLFAGKLHALLYRKYAKGRDYYDLLFYLRKKKPFNLELFINAARQTHPQEIFTDAKSVLSKLRATLNAMDDNKIRKDVAPFLLNPEEGKFINAAYLTMALNQNIEAGIFTQP